MNWMSAKSLLIVVSTAVLVGGCAIGSAVTGETRNDTLSFDVDDAKSARVELSMGSGELHVNSGTSKLMEGKFSYNSDDWKPTVDYRPGGTTGQLRISQPNSSGSGFGASINDWDVKLNGDLPLDVVASLGAGEATLTLGKMNLNRVEMSIGAGKVQMDLRGEPRRDYAVHIRGGVGETIVYLPRDAGISATPTKGIGDISIEGLEQRDGVWINPERTGAPVTVRVRVEGGIGQIRLIR